MVDYPFRDQLLRTSNNFHISPTEMETDTPVLPTCISEAYYTPPLSLTIVRILADAHLICTAWLYYYDLTIKQQSSKWKHPSSPTPKKAKTVKSAGKVMIIFFFIMKELCISTLFEPGTNVNDSSYMNVLRTMVQHVKSKRPLLRNGFLLHHDNARPHITRCVLDVSQQNNVEILPHPPYSSDLTPCDFWMFHQLKKPLRGKRFASNKACEKAAEAVLK
ncbi:histone-lysine N-methyltransferase SETMAR [Trichonephila clavipes]|nr:histone-lysine N-methyltransferase SETMAR [Trichonephila clavipes]